MNDFGSHVSRTPQCNIFENSTLWVLNRKPEISNFALITVVDKNVCGFQISMEDIFFGEVFEAEKNLINVFSDFFLIEVFFHFKERLQIPISAIFTEYIAIISGSEGIKIG